LAGSNLLTNKHQGHRGAHPRWFIQYGCHENNKKTDLQPISTQQALHFMSPNVQTGVQCRRGQVPPLLSLQSYHEQTTGRVHLETAGTNPLKEILNDLPAIDSGRCAGCGRCVAACPQRLFTLDQTGFRKTGRLRFSERCTRCGLCLENCPVAAITEQSAKVSPP